jgi:DNA-directed RNA polymerase subunit RPC12/RpoP
MPLYHYICSKCFESDRRLLSVEEGKKYQLCKRCSYQLIRVPQPPSTHVKEILDNGAMPKAVERFSEAERLNKERVGK